MRSVLSCVCVFVVLFQCSIARAQTPLSSEWTYQGRINLMGSPIDGTADLEFTLHDASTLGSQIGPVVALNSVDVVDGIFSVQLDFGVNAFQGDARWLEISVRSPSGVGPMTTLAPRQLLTATPYSLQTRGLYVDAFDRLGLGTNDPSQKLHVYGNIQADGWIGSDINTPVALWTNNVQALLLSYGEFDDGTGAKPAPNILGGSPSNRIQSGAVGSIIAGGGYENSFGTGNYVSDSFCAILGGRSNQAGDNIVGIREQYATAVGGYSNAALSDYSFIGGGYDNVTAGEASAVVGGRENAAVGGPYNFVGGGYQNDMDSPNSYSVIAGGRQNYTRADYATIPGGYLNEVTADYGFAAGRRAKALHAGSFVWGDSSNADISSTASNQFLVRASGGVGINTDMPLAPLHVRNLALGLDSSSTSNDDIMIESDDAIMGLYSTGSGSWSSGIVLGEVDGTGSLMDKWAMVRQSAGGSSRLHLTYGTSAAYANNSQIVSINKTGQVGLGIAPFFPLHMSSGAHCSVGGTWTNASSRTLKENFELVDRQAILGRLMEIPVSRWNYKVEGEMIEHIGPMAEDFAAAFQTGESETAIATIDADGVALAAIQALYDIIKEKDAEIHSLRSENADLDVRLARIEELLASDRVNAREE